ncbi:hypothetical protein [Carboxylicivirga sp. RSCT41]|uniref:hypothetical protein n=1 Tax=Carboxylicivirga agarovorans TaxID=3417570 RepID=UPI003D33BF54
MDFVGLLLMALCLLPAWFGRRRIQFLFCPSDVIGFNKKNQYFGLYSLLPSLIAAAFLIAYLRELFLRVEILKEFESFAILIGGMVFIAFLYYSGIMADFIVYYSNDRYKKWRDTNKKGR